MFATRTPIASLQQRLCTVLVSVVALALTACGPAARTSPKNATHTAAPTQDAFVDPVADHETTKDVERSVIVVEAMRIEVVQDEDGTERVIARDARGLFDEGNDALAKGDYQAALTLYDDLLSDFAESALAPAALYNAGLALEGLGQVDAAVARYNELADRPGSAEEGIDGRIRAAAVLAERERWSDALGVLDAALATANLSVSSRLEVMARRGYVLLESKDYAGAEKQLGAALDYYKSKDAKRAVFDSDYFAAMAHFYLGDVPRRQFDAIEIRLPDSQMARDLEAKANLVLLASDRFGDTVEFGNIYWATAAGFRLADMQREFWAALMRAPVPPHLGELAAKMYVEQVHEHARSLLEKALSIHGKNVQLATLYKTPTQWSAASADEVVRLTELIGRDRAGLEVRTTDMLAPGQTRQADAGGYLPGRIEL